MTMLPRNETQGESKDITLTEKAFTDIVDISDRGLAYGDGLFETIAYVNEVLVNWELHWQRLNKGAKRLAISLPKEDLFLEQIHSMIAQDALLEMSSSSDRVIKIIATRGQGGRGYLYPGSQIPTIVITIHGWPERAAADYHCGIAVTVCQTRLAVQPALAGIKHLNRLEQVLGRNEFSGTAYQEGIMLRGSYHSSTYPPSMTSKIIEGTSSNIFFVNNGHLYTPKIDTCGVQGTIRQAILVLADQMDIIVGEEHYSLHDLMMASEIFLCNSVFGIVPVASISIAEEAYWDHEPLHSERTIMSRLAAVINKTIKRPDVR